MQRSNFWEEIWAGARPFLVAYASDFLCVGTIWVGLYLSQKISQLLEVTGLAAALIIEVTNVGALLAVVGFVAFAVADTVSLLESRPGRLEEVGEDENGEAEATEPPPEGEQLEENQGTLWLPEYLREQRRREGEDQ